MEEKKSEKLRLYNELCMKKKYRRTVSWKKRNRKN